MSDIQFNKMPLDLKELGPQDIYPVGSMAPLTKKFYNMRKN